MLLVRIQLQLSFFFAFLHTVSVNISVNKLFLQLFDHIAACLAQFAHDVGLRGEKLPLGFTFSFPCSQQGLTSGRLINWTKGFKCSGVEGRDVVRLLQDAVHRRQVCNNLV